MTSPAYIPAPAVAEFRHLALVAFRLAVAGVWIIAAVAKLRAPEEAEPSVQRMIGGPLWLVRSVARLLPIAEMVLGLVLLLAWHVHLFAAASTLLFLVFAVLIERAAIRSALDGEGCGCFGVRGLSSANGAALATRSVARNLVLAMLAAAVACRG